MAYPKSAIFRRLILEAWFAWHFKGSTADKRGPVDTVVAVLNGLDWEENEGLPERGRFGHPGLSKSDRRGGRQAPVGKLRHEFSAFIHSHG
jgi:hypothetical protein